MRINRRNIIGLALLSPLAARAAQIPAAQPEIEFDEEIDDYEPPPRPPAVELTPTQFRMRLIGIDRRSQRRWSELQPIFFHPAVGGEIAIAPVTFGVLREPEALTVTGCEILNDAGVVVGYGPLDWIHLGPGQQASISGTKWSAK